MGIFDIRPPDDDWRNFFPHVEDGQSCGLTFLGFVLLLTAVLSVWHVFFN
jgi:hypothetical protein